MDSPEDGSSGKNSENNAAGAKFGSFSRTHSINSDSGDP